MIYKHKLCFKKLVVYPLLDCIKDNEPAKENTP